MHLVQEMQLDAKHAGKKDNRRHFVIFFLHFFFFFLQKIRFDISYKLSSLVDNVHEVSKPVFWKNKIRKISSICRLLN